MTHQLLQQIRTDIAGLHAALGRDIADAKTDLLGEIDGLKAELSSVKMQLAQSQGGGGGAAASEELKALGQAVGRVEQSTNGVQQRVDAILARMG